MVSMQTRRREADVTIGPCPGCDNWQLDYTYEAAQTYVEWRRDSMYELGSEEPVAEHTYPDLQPFHDVVEEILQEHYDECPHLRDLVEPHL